MSKAASWIVLAIVACVAAGGYVASRAALRNAEQARAAETKAVDQRIAALEKRIADQQTVITQLAARENARVAAAKATAAPTKTAAATKRPPALPNLNSVRAGGPKAVEVTNP